MNISSNVNDRAKKNGFGIAERNGTQTEHTHAGAKRVKRVANRTNYQQIGVGAHIRFGIAEAEKLA